MIYLDNAATTQITRPVLDEMMPYLTTNYGNASAPYSLGHVSKLAIEKARERVAKALNADAEQIFFTSGATEGNNWIISQYNDSVLCSNVEHHSILNNPKHNEIGCFNLENAIYIYMPSLVTHMMVNNETGTIYDVKEFAEISHIKKVPFHTDATQAFGHVPINVKTLDVDSLVLSGHKFHAPKGIGVMYLKEPEKYEPMFYGGGQEHGMRSGTENVASIVAIGKACELYNYNKDTDDYIKSLKDHLANFIETNIPNVINNSKDNAVNNILNVSFKGIESESLMIILSLKDICVSAGSACNSGSLEPSHVLKELKVPDDYINGTIRFSFSEFNTLDEIIATEKVLKESIKMLRG